MATSLNRATSESHGAGCICPAFSGHRQLNRLARSGLWAKSPCPCLRSTFSQAQSCPCRSIPTTSRPGACGFARGKAECWFVIDAEPGALIGLGLRREISPETLRSAALDGTVEQLIAWRPVASGDFFFVPPGTIHAIGAGISLLELQQNSDITYRLYDYGRGRDIHLDDGIAVARCDPYPEQLFQRVNPAADVVLVDGPHFTLVHSHCDALQGRERLLMPIEGFAAIGDEIAHPGECLFLSEHQRLDSVEGRLLVAAAPQMESSQLRVAA